MVYTFDDSTQNWVLNVYGDGSEFTFADGATAHPGADFTAGWVFGITPEPSSLFLLGSAYSAWAAFFASGCSRELRGRRSLAD